MRRALALVLLLAICGAVLAFGGGARPTAALAFGFALIAAALVGDLFERFHLPRLTGYLALRHRLRPLRRQPDLARRWRASCRSSTASPSR